MSEFVLEPLGQHSTFFPQVPKPQRKEEPSQMLSADPTTAWRVSFQGNRKTYLQPDEKVCLVRVST